jgi:serine/threonine protein phosphatase PrpC
MLACDGLWDLHTNEETIKIIHEQVYEKFERGKELNLNAFYSLIDSCCSPEYKGEIGGDNITAILIELGEFK